MDSDSSEACGYPQAPTKSHPEPAIEPRREVIAAVLTKFWAAASSVDQRDDRGQGLAEYALILGLIAIVAIVALIFFGSQVSDKLTIIGNAV